MNDKELINECLLTPGEQAPFVHTDLVDYGDTTVGEEVWDIEGLLKAQVLKAIPTTRKAAEAERLDRPELREKLTMKLCVNREDIIPNCNECLHFNSVSEHRCDNPEIDELLTLFPNEKEIRRVVAEENTLMKRALKVIEGSLLADEPEDKRLGFIYRMAHVGNGKCKHTNWEEELNVAYQGLIDGNIISAPSGKGESNG